MATRLAGFVALTLTAAAVVIAAGGCTNVSMLSRTKDIFSQDQQNAAATGNDRRRQATSADLLWTVYVNLGDEWCSGHMISPSLMMTAGHCAVTVGQRYLSGFAQSSGSTPGLDSDMAVTSVVEVDHNLDYAIVEVKWDNGYPPQQHFPAKIAIAAANVSVSPNPNQGDAVFTVGFPSDTFAQWGGTYSRGNLKQVDDSLLYYNLASINGNSGGGVWRASDFMLVALTDTGPHSLGQDGWDTGSADDPGSWNYGPTIWEIYAASQTLQDTFPNGLNRYPGAYSGGNTGGSGSTVADANDLWIAIGEVDSAAPNNSFLYASVPATVQSVVFCNGTQTCTNNSDGLTGATFLRTQNGRSLFRANASTPLANAQALTALGGDQTKNILVSRSVRLALVY